MMGLLARLNLWLARKADRRSRDRAAAGAREAERRMAEAMLGKRRRK